MQNRLHVPIVHNNLVVHVTSTICQSDKSDRVHRRGTSLSISNQFYQSPDEERERKKCQFPRLG